MFHRAVRLFRFTPWVPCPRSSWACTPTTQFKTCPRERGHGTLLVAVFGALWFAGNLVSTRSFAAEEQGIVVSGTGEVKAKPNRAEIVLNNAGKAELTGDAITKYQDSLRRTKQALEGLKIKSLEITPEGLGVATAGGQAGQQVVFNNGNESANVKLEMAISRSLRVALTGIADMPEDELIQTLARILDAAQDSGAKLGSSADQNAMVARMIGIAGTGSAAVTFVLDGVEELREQAYQKAFAHAQSRAERLAKLAGSELGAVQAVSEAASGGSNPASVQERIMSAVYGVGVKNEKEDQRVTSDKFEEIPVQVTLQVRFALKPKAQP